MPMISRNIPSVFVLFAVSIFSSAYAETVSVGDGSAAPGNTVSASVNFNNVVNTNGAAGLLNGVTFDVFFDDGILESPTPNNPEAICDGINTRTSDPLIDCFVSLDRVRIILETDHPIKLPQSIDLGELRFKIKDTVEPNDNDKTTSLTVQFDECIGGESGVEALGCTRRNGTITIQEPTREGNIASVDFGNVPVDTTSSVVQAILTGTNLSVTGPASLPVNPNGVFEITNDGCEALIPLQTNGSEICRVDLTCTPNAGGTINGTVRVPTNAGDIEGQLVCTGIEPDGRIEPATIDFNSVTVGTTSPAQAAIVTGNETLVIEGAASLPANPGGIFDIASDGCGANTTSTNGIECRVEVTCSPAAQGEFTGTLRVPSNAGNLDSTLRCTGVPEPVANATLNSGSTNFGEVELGQSRDLTYALISTGTLPLQIDAGPTLSSTTDFSLVTTDCPQTLAPGAFCTIQVRFAPTSTGIKSTTLSVRTNAEGNDGERRLDLQGTGVDTTAPDGAFTGDTNFGNVLLGQTDNLPTRTFTLESTGTAPLVINAAPGLSGAHPNDFSIVGTDCTLNRSLSPNGSCTVEVRFSPQAAGDRSAALGVGTNARPFSLTLQGTGVQPQPAATLTPEAVQTFPETRVGQTSEPITYTLTSTGTADLVVSGASLDNTDDFAVLETAGNSCQVNQVLATDNSCIIQVVFTPREGSDKSATLTVSTNLDQPFTRGLAGSASTTTDLAEDLIDQFQLPPNQASVLGNLAGAVDAGTAGEALQADVATLLDAGLANDPNFLDATNQITPDVEGNLNVGLQSVGMQVGNVAARLAALRAGATGFDLGGLGLEIDGTRISGRQMQGLMEAFANGGAASADGSDFGRLGVFVSGRISRGRYSETANSDAFRYRVTALTAGVDYRLRDDFVLGGALGYSRNKTNIQRDRGDLDSDGYSGTLYGTWYQDSGVFVDGSITAGRGDYDQNRNVNYTLPTVNVTVDQVFSSSFKGSHFGVAVSGGYEHRVDEFTLIPFGRVQYMRTRIDGYRENISNPGQPGAGWAVEIDSHRAESLTSALGVQGTYAISQPWGVLMPFASAEWIHEFRGSNDPVTGRSIDSGNGDRFSIDVDSFDSNYFNFGLGVSAQFPNGTSGFVNYQRVEGFSNLRHYSINAGLRFEF